LVCKALNLPFIEQNASDNRSQTTMEKLEINSAYLIDENQTMDKHVRKKKIFLHSSRSNDGKTPVITNVKDFKHPSAPCGISFVPGASGPPRLRKLL